MNRFFSLMILLLLPLALQGQQAATAAFKPDTVSLGQRVAYEITLTNLKTSSNPVPPDVKGLDWLSGTSVSSSTSYINGAVSSTVTYTYEARPLEAGVIRLPSWQIQASGRTVTLPEALLTVTQPKTQPSGSEAIIFSQKLPEHLFSGQTFETTVELFISSDLIQQKRVRQLDNFRSLVSTLVAESLPAKPLESVETIRGNSYHVFRWKQALTAPRSGVHDVQYAVDLILLNRESSRFSMFDQLERRTFESTLQKVTAEPLPTAGQPDSFRGAIGIFSLSQKWSSPKGRVGEPLLFTVEVTGKGNFSRMTEPPLRNADAFQVLESTTVFEPSDNLGMEGTRRFEFQLIPRQPGTLDSPVVDFSFFIPDSGEYATLSTRPQALEISPSPVSAALPVPSASAPASVSAEPSKPAPATLVQSTFDSPSGPPRLPFFTFGFWFSQLSFAAAFLWLFQLTRPNRIPSPLELRRTHVHSRLKALRDAPEASRLPLAIDLLRWTLARPEDASPDALALEELTSRLAGSNLSPELRQKAEELIRSCQNARYAGGIAEASALSADSFESIVFALYPKA